MCMSLSRWWRKRSSRRASLYLLEPFESRLLLSVSPSLIDSSVNFDLTRSFPAPANQFPVQTESTVSMTPENQIPNSEEHEFNVERQFFVTSHSSFSNFEVTLAATRPAGGVYTTSPMAGALVFAQVTGSGDVVDEEAEIAIMPDELTSEKAAIAATQIRLPTVAPPTAAGMPASFSPVIAWQEDEQGIDSGASFDAALRHQRKPTWSKTLMTGPRLDQDILDLVVQYKRLRITY